MMIGVTTVDGVEHFSGSTPSDEISAEQMDGIEGLLKNFPTMTNFIIEDDDGQETYFNPANIICVKIYLDV